MLLNMPCKNDWEVNSTGNYCTTWVKQTNQAGFLSCTVCCFKMFLGPLQGGWTWTPSYPPWKFYQENLCHIIHIWVWGWTCHMLPLSILARAIFTSLSVSGRRLHVSITASADCKRRVIWTHLQFVIESYFEVSLLWFGVQISDVIRIIRNQTWVQQLGGPIRYGFNRSIDYNCPKCCLYRTQAGNYEWSATRA